MQLTLEDFQRLIVLLLIIFIGIAIAKKAARFGAFCLSLICLLQVGFMLSQTSLNDKIPLDKYFKYDFLSSIMSIWENTDKEELKNDLTNAADKVLETTDEIINITDEVIDNLNSKNNTETEEEIPPEIQSEETPPSPE